jgi:hypothetical protein
MDSKILLLQAVDVNETLPFLLPPENALTGAEFDHRPDEFGKINIGRREA